jgi:hypothetical protein
MSDKVIYAILRLGLAIALINGAAILKRKIYPATENKKYLS